jgi:hypothetical protein
MQLDIVTKEEGRIRQVHFEGRGVASALYKAHDLHGHFALRITLGKFSEDIHWPTRVEDVKELGSHLGILVRKYYICNESSYIISCVPLIRLSRRLSIYLSSYGNSTSKTQCHYGVTQLALWVDRKHSSSDSTTSS